MRPSRRSRRLTQRRPPTLQARATGCWLRLLVLRMADGVGVILVVGAAEAVIRWSICSRAAKQRDQEEILGFLRSNRRERVL
jgi:hypothetical protein